MTNLNQQILKFDYEQNFKDQDFYVSNSNEHSFSLLNSWPKWDKNFINLIGENFSGKSHLINIFLKKNKGIKINSEDISNDFLQKIKIYENIIVEDLTEKINEKKPKDINLVLEVADKYFSIQQYDDCMQLLLKNYPKNKNQIKEKMIELFEVLGNSSEYTITYRKRLSQIMFS